MCGRFTHFYTWKQLQRIMRLTMPLPHGEPAKRYNVAPTQTAPAVRAAAGETGGAREVFLPRWGLIPSWAKDAAIGNSLINARSETAAEKPSFRSAMKKRRCIVPVSGFYEWRKIGEKGKQPYYIRLASGEVMAVAGLWEAWRDTSAGDGAPIVESFAILTTSANEQMKPLHDRMPVILDGADIDAWLDEKTDAEALARLMKPAPEGILEMIPVSTRVNSPRNDEASCINPIAAQGDFFSSPT